MTRKNRLFPNSKLTAAAVSKILHSFVSGFSLNETAAYAETSRRTVARYYKIFRMVLTRKEYNEWHFTHRSTTGYPGYDLRELLIRMGGDCYFNQICDRNWRLGNRKARQCLSCPFRSGDVVVPNELFLIVVNWFDEARQFYRETGIRDRRTGGRVAALAYLQLVHASVVSTALDNSKFLPNGLVDIDHRRRLSGGRLFSIMAGHCEDALKVFREERRDAQGFYRSD